MDKSELRKVYKAKRVALSDSQVQAMDLQVLDQLKSLPWDTIQYLHCYLPIAKFKELNTHPFLAWIAENYPAITLVISKSDFLTQELTHFEYHIDTILQPNAWGIPEPLEGKQVDPLLIDAVITPLLVADVHGNRVGYGKGFYDRFFSACRPNVLKIGLSYFDPIPQISELSTWDVPLSILVSPGKIYAFEN